MGQQESKAQPLSELKKLDPRYLAPEHVKGFEHHVAEGDGYSAWMLHKYYAHQHDPKAGEYLLLAANRGVPEAQCSYYAILIQNPDRKVRESAVIWLKKAAAQGYEPAKEWLGHHDEVLRLSDLRHASSQKP
ncbi:hypothetical protein [Prosthecobacter sp.]|uniref:hypothetical protein n=1 Tax=Prosthecobacter sp. TaxID=1965333 RepID=UPI0037833EB5